MSTDNVTGPHISSYMDLNQAMGEVRAYLDKKKRQAGMSPEAIGFPAGQLSMQSAFIARLADIATRLGQVDPNSNLGPVGVFLKRLLCKMIGWYSRPAQDFDRTTVECSTRFVATCSSCSNRSLRSTKELRKVRRRQRKSFQRCTASRPRTRLNWCAPWFWCLKA